MPINRRHFLALGLSGLVHGVSGSLSYTPRTRDSCRENWSITDLLEIFDHRQSAVKIGRIYLQQHPENADKYSLAEQLLSDASDLQAALESGLQHRVRQALLAQHQTELQTEKSSTSMAGCFQRRRFGFVRLVFSQALSKVSVARHRMLGRADSFILHLNDLTGSRGVARYRPMLTNGILP
jgi:hypothetical protein